MKSKMRQERDSLGTVNVPADKKWGAQTERSRQNFAIGEEKMPYSIIKAIAVIKKAAAEVNAELGVLTKQKARWIAKAADQVISGKLCDQFPLSVWQTGSGTQTNMNVNEVIAHVAPGKLHPNDDVNCSQSSNDVFSTAMQISTVLAIKEKLLPSLHSMLKTLKQKERAFAKIQKVGRTHLQDAVPLTVGQEFSAYVDQLFLSIEQIKAATKNFLPLPIGGTAVGTGLNAPKGFDRLVVKKIVELTGVRFTVAKNKFSRIAAHDSFVTLSGALKTLATFLMKLANDIRWLSCGPRCGLNEYCIPANEPGSSIMPGKVNPTQAEALLMVCAQVIGNDVTITIANAHSELQLNVFKPVIIYNILQSIHLLSDGIQSFTDHLLKNLKVNKKQLADYVENSLMHVTTLVPEIGYDKAAEIAKYAFENDLTIEAACQLLLGYS